MAVATATGLSAVAREVVHRVERAATSDTGERLVLRRRRQLREVVPLPCRSMHARLRAHTLRELVEECRTSKVVGVKVADRILFIYGAKPAESAHKSAPAHAGP